MTKSKRFSRNLAKPALLLNLLLIIVASLSGCYFYTEPTYIKEDAAPALEEICRKEYKIEIKAKMVGSTLWVYLPLEDIISEGKKPEKYIERFAIEQNLESLRMGTLKSQYLIKPVPEKEILQSASYSKDAANKRFYLWQALSRLLFSMEPQKRGGLQFFVIVIADIKNGFSLQEVFYYLDLKKVSYNLISGGEFQHRTIQDTAVSQEIVGDKEGKYLEYRDITMEDFIVGQIQYRIKLKFQKPEVERNADIDKEILQIITYTLKTYGFKDFQSVELENLLTNKKIILNQPAIWARPAE